MRRLIAGVILMFLVQVPGSATTAYRSISPNCQLPAGMLMIKEADILEINSILEDAAMELQWNQMRIEFLEDRVRTLEEMV